MSQTHYVSDGHKTEDPIKMDMKDIIPLDIDIGDGVVVDATEEFSEAYYRKLRCKIDLWLLPLMWIAYGTQQADKTAISTMAVFGLREDTGLVGEQYNWLSTIFYISYLVCEFPGNYFMQKFHVGKFLGIVITSWGIVVLCIAFAQNWAGLMVLRTLQGALECTISPTFMLITGAFYTSGEHTLRALIWGTSNAGMNIITGLCMYGIGAHAKSHPGVLAPWRGISLFLGALTITVGVLSYFIIGTPREVCWLSEEEKRASALRTMKNKTGSDREKRSEFKWEQVWTTFRDPQTYFFSFLSVVNALPNGANTTFAKLIWQSFGFTPLETLLKGSTPYYCVSICWFVVVGFLTYKKPGLRFFLAMFSLLPAFTGMLALSLLPTDSMKWTRWGMYILQVFGTLPSIMIWTFLPSNVAGRTKKTVTATVLFVSYCVGNAVGAQMFVASDAPKYVHGITACAVLYIVEFTGFGAWRTYYVWQNKRRARAIQEQGFSEVESERQGKLNAEADMTDFENIHFRYQY